MVSCVLHRYVLITLSGGWIRGEIGRHEAGGSWERVVASEMVRSDLVCDAPLLLLQSRQKDNGRGAGGDAGERKPGHLHFRGERPRSWGARPSSRRGPPGCSVGSGWHVKGGLGSRCGGCSRGRWPMASLCMASCRSSTLRFPSKPSARSRGGTRTS